MAQSPVPLPLEPVEQREARWRELQKKYYDQGQELNWFDKLAVNKILSQEEERQKDAARIFCKPLAAHLANCSIGKFLTVATECAPQRDAWKLCLEKTYHQLRDKAAEKEAKRKAELAAAAAKI